MHSQPSRRAHRSFAAIVSSLMVLSGLLPVGVAPAVMGATSVFINEIHYDNVGADEGEAIEVAGPAGTNLAGWTIALYNGSGGATYSSQITLSGTIPDEGSGFGTVSAPAVGLQNGSPDGLALVNGTTVVQFLSYEGTFAATTGPAAGLTSTDIGVSQDGSGAVGLSLGLQGTGTSYEEFTWASLDDSFGAVNPGQTFGGVVVADPVINEFSASTAGTDVEYLEVFGAPNTDLSAHTILEIEGDAGATAGTVDEVVAVGTTDTAGLWHAALPSNALENGSITLLLVSGFTGTLNADLDSNNDGTFDSTPWTAILDAVAVNDGGPADLAYGVPVLGVAYDGQEFAPGGASRIPDGTDTDTSADWVRNDFDLAGIPLNPGSPTVGEAYNTPGAPNAVVESPILINEVDSDTAGTDTLEFVELYDGGAGGTSLNGLVVVLYNGSNNLSYAAFDLDGFATDANGYFVLGNAAVSPAPGVIFSDNVLQNGADAVAVFEGDATDFPNNTPVTTADLRDALVYGTDDADDPELLALLNAGQPQVNEAGGGDPAADSSQRCPNGSGGARNTTSYAQAAPTSGATNGCVVDAALSVDDVTLNEGDGGTTSFVFTVSLSSAAPTGGVTFDIATADDTALTSDSDYTASSLTGQTIPAGQTSYQFTVLVNGDSTNEPTESFFVNVTNVTGAPVADGQGVGTIANDDLPVTPIHDIQGNDDTVAPGTFTVEAIVVGDYQAQGPGDLRGFFLQEEDADADTDAATSEGIFVFCAACPVDVSVGDAVRVTGSSSDFFGMSQLSATTAGSVAVRGSSSPLPTPGSIELPVPGVPDGDLAAATAAINAYFEPFEGMLVTHADTLSVSEYFELARYGQLLLSEGGRPHTFTAVNEPSAAGLIDHEIDLARRTVILDDTDNRQNRPVDTPNTAYYHPVPGLSTGNLVRGGDTITDLTGVLHWSFAGQTGTDAWRIRPVTEAFSYAFTSANPRPGSVPDVGGRLKVAGFNVLNYFLTIDTTSSTSSGPCGASQTLDCRGADSEAELGLQRAKMLAALSAMDADIFGLMEMENTPGVDPSADIVAGLPGYAYIDTDVIGGDAIRVGFIYKTSAVKPIGDFAILDSSVDPDFDTSLNRPALAQTFEEVATGARLTVVVNHLKSKGSGCGPGDDDTTTGQGNCNGTRTRAAGALARWLATDPTDSGDEDVLIIGDLNSYAKEDPIVALQDAGYTDLVGTFGGADAYGFVFDGQLGYLDHGMSNESLTPQVTGAAEWHINADEIPLFDYNDDVRDAPGESAFEEESDVTDLYEPNQFRSSDHDPVVVGLDLQLGPLYLHNNPTPPTGDTRMQHPLPMDADAPTATTLFNYDSDRDSRPGRLIQKGGSATTSDRTKFQSWRTQTFGEAVALEGDVTFEFWSAMKDFTTDKRGHVNAYLMDGTTIIATASLNPSAAWQGGSPTWVEKSITFSGVNRTIAAGSFLQLRVVVGPNSGDDMWFAYDTASLRSRLIMP